MEKQDQSVTLRHLYTDQGMVNIVRPIICRPDRECRCSSHLVLKEDGQGKFRKPVVSLSTDIEAYGPRIRSLQMMEVTPELAERIFDVFCKHFTVDEGFDKKFNSYVIYIPKYRTENGAIVYGFYILSILDSSPVPVRSKSDKTPRDRKFFGDLKTKLTKRAPSSGAIEQEPGFYMDAELEPLNVPQKDRESLIKEKG